MIQVEDFHVGDKILEVHGGAASIIIEIDDIYFKYRYLRPPNYIFKYHICDEIYLLEKGKDILIPSRKRILKKILE